MTIELLLPRTPSQTSDLENKLFPLPSEEKIKNTLSGYEKDLGNEYEPLLNSLIELTKEIEDYYAQLRDNDVNKKKRGFFSWLAYLLLPHLEKIDEKSGKDINKALQNMECEFNYHRILLFGDDPKKEPLYELYLQVKYHAVHALGNDKQMEETLRSMLTSLNKKKASDNS